MGEPDQLPRRPETSDDEDEPTYDLAVDIFGRATVPDHVESAEPEDLALVLEAVCFSLNRPVTLTELAAILGRTQVAVAAAVEVLSAQLRGRGLMLQRHAGALQMVTRPQAAWAVQRALHPDRPTRLSRAALETLAIVAYRQPVTRASIEAVRGVNCEAVLENLERRGLVAEVDRQETPGRPRRYGTTLRFLQIVGLEQIDDLPPLADLPVPGRPAAPPPGDGPAVVA